ncbi:DUF2778 domain-containing protein [Trinickia sp. LjRoot230]|uniref:DUF2778 domain-containing protein n=1 Tax=Trinickia sp. LjRoot230 TaxID=3342288 RepID=UPI003ECDE5B7
MSAQCTFSLNGQPISALVCNGQRFPAFSGDVGHENKPEDTALAKAGPIPKGRYYIIARQSGGRLGWLRDPILDEFSNSHRHEWFSLHPVTRPLDDWVIVNGVRRDGFRLHPAGRQRLSEGCITLTERWRFNALRSLLLSLPPSVIPNTKIRYYGVVEVQ